MSEPIEIWIVCWNWSDNSGFGILESFKDEESAKKYLGCLNRVSDRTLSIHKSELIERF